MCFFIQTIVLTFIFIILLDPFYQLLPIRFYARLGIDFENCMELLALLACAGLMELSSLFHLSFVHYNYIIIENSSYKINISKILSLRRF